MWHLAKYACWYIFAPVSAFERSDSLLSSIWQKEKPLRGIRLWSGLVCVYVCSLTFTLRHEKCPWVSHYGYRGALEGEFSFCRNETHAGTSLLSSKCFFWLMHFLCLLTEFLFSLLFFHSCSRPREAGDPLCHMSESCHKNCKPGETQRVCVDEGKIVLFFFSVPHEMAEVNWIVVFFFCTEL